MITFETYTKKDFIDAFNNSVWSSWGGRFEFPNEFRRTTRETYVDVGKLGVFAMQTMALRLIKGLMSLNVIYL
jgi:hypothetical protein